MTEISTAVHEAGHAVIARALGLSSGGCSVIPNEDEDEAGHSITYDPFAIAGDWERRGKFREMRSVFRGRIIAYMAGAEAENVIIGACAGGDGHDRFQIEVMADSSDSGIGAEEWPSLEIRLRAKCRMLVRRHRHRIELISAALMKHGQLTAKEVDELACFQPFRSKSDPLRDLLMAPFS